MVATYKRPAAHHALQDAAKGGKVLLQTSNLTKKAGKQDKMPTPHFVAGPNKVLIVPPPAARQCWWCGYRSGSQGAFLQQALSW
jgi:hypothetical protein